CRDLRRGHARTAAAVADGRPVHGVDHRAHRGPGVIPVRSAPGHADRAHPGVAAALIAAPVMADFSIKMNQQRSNIAYAVSAAAGIALWLRSSGGARPHEG